MSEARHPLELDPDIRRCSDCGNPWDYCECPDAEAQQAREAKYKELEAVAASLRRERDSMTQATKHETKLTTALVEEMHRCAEQNHHTAARARRTMILAQHSLENYEPGSPWHIAEKAILNATKRVHELETELAESFETAAKQIEALDT